MAVAAKFRLQAKWRLWLLVLVFALWNGASAEARKRVICEEAPPWTALVVKGDDVAEEGLQVNPMQEGRGKVLVVALTSASSQHSLEQAVRLGDLEEHFHGREMPDVSFILINSAQSNEHLAELLSKNLTMLILQENAHDPVWSKLGGKRDHVFIYDRCGRLTFKIPYPLSHIRSGQSIVESSVSSTYLEDICGEQNCSVPKEESPGANGKDLLEPTQIANNPEQGQEVAPRPPESQLLNGLWSLYRKMMKHMPWASNSNDERHVNSVRKFLEEEKDEEKDEETTATPVLTEESQAELCNITQKSICRAWPKKKIDHARICCNLHTCNRSTQYLQKHCKHYPEHRCKKVQLVLQCCNRTEEKDSDLDEMANTRASTSSLPKS